MRTQAEGSVVTAHAVMKREFQTHKIITLSFAYIHFLKTTVKFKLNHTKIRTLILKHIKSE